MTQFTSVRIGKSTFGRGLYFILPVFFLVALSSCNLFDKSGPIPAYIYIEKFQVETKEDGSQGTASYDIPDAWVYVGNELIGVFEVPVTVPIIKTGEQKVTIFAGIRKNGLANTRITYPFYTTFTDTIDMVETEIDTVVPIIRYFESIQFPLIEDFEDNSISFAKSGGSDITVDTIHITKDPLEVFDYDGDKNKASGVVNIPIGSQIFQNSSISTYDLPRRDHVYLELNYKIDAAMQVGLTPIKSGLTQSIPILLLFPTDGEWKKAYISLGEDINSSTFDGAEFKVFFDAVSKNDLEETHLYLDNIKLVHR